MTRYVYRDDEAPVHHIPGIEHRTLAGSAHGLRQIEVFAQRIAPGMASPLHRHDCEEVILVQEGSGVLEIDGTEHPFGPRSTLVVPRDALHRLACTGGSEMVIVAVFGGSPVVVRDEKGERIPLPW